MQMKICILHLIQSSPSPSIPCRLVWRWQDHPQLCAGGVPGVARHPQLLAGRRQHPPRPQPEPGLLLRGPRGEHPACGRGGQAVRRRWPGVHHQLHLALH